MTNLVAETILRQLGGRRFVAMTGANKLTARPNGLYFCVNRGKRYTIMLNAKDLYDVEYTKWNGRKMEWSLVDDKFARDVHAENLQQVFTAHTGLDTHL